MRFIPLDNFNYTASLKFLASYEHNCVSLIEQVRHKHNSIFVIENNNSIVTGVISCKNTILHCLPDASNNQKNTALYNELASFLKDKNISCINGEKVGSNLIMDILSEKDIKPMQVNNYELMTLMPEPLENAKSIDMQIAHNDACQLLPKNWKIIKCGSENIEELMPLQVAYETEEVVPKCRTLKIDNVRKHLEHILKKEFVIAIQNNDGQLIAKANTNAIGIHYAQIGGVYTIPQCRSNHYASLLLETLILRIIKSYRRPVLYVKNNNEIAKKVYTSLGFKKSRDFIIAYY